MITLGRIQSENLNQAIITTGEFSNGTFEMRLKKHLITLSGFRCIFSLRSTLHFCDRGQILDILTLQYTSLRHLIYVILSICVILTSMYVICHNRYTSILTVTNLDVGLPNVQCPLLNWITLGRIKSDNINPMIQ